MYKIRKQQFENIRELFEENKLMLIDVNKTNSNVQSQENTNSETELIINKQSIPPHFALTFFINIHTSKSFADKIKDNFVTKISPSTLNLTR